MTRRNIFILLFCFFTIHVNSQDELYSSLNRYDLNGRKTGKWIEYWPGTTRLKSVEHFSEGKRNGVCIYLNEYGYLMEESDYSNDSLHGISKKYTSVGTLKETAEFKNGRKEGFTRYYDYKRQVIEETEFHDNIRDGVHRIYYASGRVQQEGTFVNGKENGTRKNYKDNDEGEIVSEADFFNDLRVEKRRYRKGRLIRVEKAPPPDQNASF